MEPRVVLAALSPVLGAERAARLDQVAAARLGGLVVVLENLHDPHNGGAALRSCEAIGVLEVHLVEAAEPFRFSPRVTQGCEKWLQLTRHKTIDSCAELLHRRGFALYAAVPGAASTLEELDPHRPAAFLLGNEHAGLSLRAQQLVDRAYRIPLHGFSQSVNLSVATALTVYTHASRRRQALGASGDLDSLALDRLRAHYYARDVRGAEAIIARFVDQGGAR